MLSFHLIFISLTLHGIHVLVSQAVDNSKKLQRGVRALGNCASNKYEFIAAITTDNKPSDNRWALTNDLSNT